MESNKSCVAVLRLPFSFAITYFGAAAQHKH
jgi:hypothetical protein